MRGGGGVRRALLFYPQTSVGLLAGVAAEGAEACVAALRLGGDADAAVIGRVTARAGGAAEIRLREAEPGVYALPSRTGG